MLAASVLALVTQDRTSLRGEPRDGAPRVALLWQGALLEARSERRGFVEVWDHAHERGGWVRAAQVRTYAASPAAVPELSAVVRFLRDTPGAEALGIAHARLALDARAPGTSAAPLLEATAVMADRLAQRASVRTEDEVVTAHLEIARGHGVRMRSVTRADGTTRLCADGGSWRQLLALEPEPDARVDAVLALTAPACVDWADAPGRVRGDAARAALLGEGPPLGAAPHRAARWKVRRARVLASVAFDRARAGDTAESVALAEQALTALAGADPAQLADEDRAAYAEAAMQVGATRWASTLRGAGAGSESPPARGLSVGARVGSAPGETCLVLESGTQRLVERCTFGQPWLASTSVSPRGDAVALAVSPLPGWRELWLFRRVDGVWGVDVLPPAVGAPELGYIEHAGWSPDGQKVLVVREALEAGQQVRSFEVLGTASLAVEVQGTRASAVRAFARWSGPEWRAGTVAMR